MSEIVIRVGKDGKLNLNVNGVKGSSCKDLTKGLEKALGVTETSKNTNDYYEQEQTVENTQDLSNG